MNWKPDRLNDILRSELGSNPYGQGRWKWAWADDLFWPSCETGRMVPKTIHVPILDGSGRTEPAQSIEREVVARPMTRLHKNCWIVARWLPPAALAGIRLDTFIGDTPRECDIPREQILARWQKMFPGADYPERGWYVTTDYFCQPDQKPTYDDNQFLIKQLRHQLSNMSINTLYADMLLAEDEEAARIASRLEDACENEFTAYLNPFPGKRGNHVSFGGVDSKQLISKEN